MPMRSSGDVPRETTRGSGQFTRRKWAAMLAAAPAALAQVSSPVPPQGVPAAPATTLTPEGKLQKALADVREVSQRLSQIELPMDVEPAFSFRV